MESGKQSGARRLPYDKFGCFFGPSEIVIAPRVAKMLVSNRGAAKPSELRKKVEMLKAARDYSFLSDDAWIPPPRPTVSVPPKSKQVLGRNLRKESKSVPLNRQVQSKAASPPSKPTSEKKISAQPARNLPPTAQKATHSSDSRQGSQQPRISKDKIRPQRPVIKKAVKQVSSPPKKRQMSEDDKAMMMLRNMLRRPTHRYAVSDDDDDRDMVANWDDIIKEETRSAKIARQEDKQQLEQELRERMSRLPKKRKLSHR